MSTIVIVYIVFAVTGLFFDQITNDLLSLGVRSELVSIASKAIGAVVAAIGVVALLQGKTLPSVPGHEDAPSVKPRDLPPPSDHLTI
jgi:hypothetical protein